MEDKTNYKEVEKALLKFKKMKMVESWGYACDALYKHISDICNDEEIIDKDQRKKNIAERNRVYAYVKEFRQFCTKEAKAGHNVETMLRLTRASYCLTGRDYFDDFIIAMEWDRPATQRFWQPRRKCLLEIANDLQSLEDDELDELFTSCPPRIGKTTLIMFFVMWVMFRHPEMTNLYCSYGDAVVGAFYDGLLEILKDPTTYKWQDVFPDVTLTHTDALERTINLGHNSRYASFTSRSLYGQLNGTCDCNGYLVADDLHSGIEEAMNKDRLNSAWIKVDNNLLTRDNTGTCKKLWIGTRWSLVDCIARRIDLISNDAHYKNWRFKVINRPALNANDESNFDYAYGVGFTTEAYLQRRVSFEKNNDIASWLAQYMGQPIERAGTVFLPDDLRYYNGTLPEGDPDLIFMTVDPAWGGGDYVAAPICYQYGDEIYVPGVVYDNNDKTITQPLVVHAAMKFGVQRISIEATKTTADYVNGISKSLSDAGYSANVVGTTSHFAGEGKKQRIFDAAPDIREHFIFLDSEHRDKAYELFMQNVYGFVFVGKNKNDDAPDSLAMAVKNVFHKNKRASIIVGSRPF